MEPLFPFRIPSQFKSVYFKSITSAFICYIIYCNKTGKWYVGSGISGRVWKHFSKSKHHNKKLYEDFMEFGPEAFLFWIYDCESKEDSISQEQILLDLLPKVPDGLVCNQKYCYNVVIKAGGGNTHDANNTNDKRNNKKDMAKSSAAGGGNKAEPWELWNAETEELIASFYSTKDKNIQNYFVTYKSQGWVSKKLQDFPAITCSLCFWEKRALYSFRYKGETIAEMEIRTGRNYWEDRAEALRFIHEVTVIKDGEERHLKDYKTYSEAACMLGLPETQRSAFSKMLQGKIPNCGGWSLKRLLPETNLSSLA